MVVVSLVFVSLCTNLFQYLKTKLLILSIKNLTKISVPFFVKLIPSSHNRSLIIPLWIQTGINLFTIYVSKIANLLNLKSKFTLVFWKYWQNYFILILPKNCFVFARKFFHIYSYHYLKMVNCCNQYVRQQRQVFIHLMILLYNDAGLEPMKDFLEDLTFEKSRLNFCLFLYATSNNKELISSLTAFRYWEYLLIYCFLEYFSHWKVFFISFLISRKISGRKSFASEIIFV